MYIDIVTFYITDFRSRGQNKTFWMFDVEKTGLKLRLRLLAIRLPARKYQYNH